MEFASSDVSPHIDHARYETYGWRNRVRVELQSYIATLLTPGSLSEDQRERWQLAWMRRYAVPFSHWLHADPERFFTIAHRLEQGPPYSAHELYDIAFELENF